jgi:lipopolysaccharide export LptBFGC system permease protein LptF
MSKRNDPLLAFWLHHKIASAVVVFWLALIPSPLALRLSSRKRTQREFLLIGLFAIVFYVLDSCLAGLGQNGCSCPILVAWLPTLFVSASFLLLHAQLLNIRIPLKAFKSTIFFAAKPLIWYFTFQSAVKTIFFTI